MSWAIILVSPRTFWTQQCQASFAMPDTSSSLTHNAATCPSGQCLTTLAHWELSASLDESITRISDFIFTCLQTSDGSFEVERLIYSMYVVGTQTSNVLGEHRRRVTTTQSRMATSWQAALNGRFPAQLDLGRLLIRGLRLRVRRLEENFGNFARSWIQRLCAVHSASCRNTPIGGLNRSLPCMSHPEDLTLLVEMMTDEIAGYHRLVLDWDRHT